MNLNIYTFEYSVNGHVGQKEIVGKNEGKATENFILWIERNFPWASANDFNYELIACN